MQSAYGVVCAMELLGLNPEEFFKKHVEKMGARGYMDDDISYNDKVCLEYSTRHKVSEEEDGWVLGAT